jgi:hypothetical protein
MTYHYDVLLRRRTYYYHHHHHHHHHHCKVVGLPWRDEATLGAMAEVERCLAAAGRGAAAVPMPPHPPLPRSAAGAAGGAQ